MYFPTVTWGSVTVTFYEKLPIGLRNCEESNALVFVFHSGKLLLANIAGRGWTIPGGRKEVGESAVETAEREAFEETGAVISTPVCIGSYLMSSLQNGAANWRCVPTFVAKALSVNSIPSGSEALGTRLIDRESLQSVYYIWDDLIEAVCNFAFVRAEELEIL